MVLNKDEFLKEYNIDEKFLIDIMSGIIPIKIGIKKYLLLIGIEFFSKVVLVSQ